MDHVITSNGDKFVSILNDIDCVCLFMYIIIMLCCQVNLKPVTCLFLYVGIATLLSDIPTTPLQDGTWHGFPPDMEDAIIWPGTLITPDVSVV